MVKRVVLTGGPGTGKTTVINKIREVYEKQGVTVIVIDETATYLIEKGIKPFGDNAIDMVDFQELVMKMQLAKEAVFDRAIEMQKNENVLIVYDRGTIDNTAYVNEDEFKEVLARLNHVKTFAELMNKYDLVLVLGGSKDFYTTENNVARSESADEALKLGETTLKCWLGHKNVRIVMPKSTIDEKINEVLNIINELLQKKTVVKQAKYLVDLRQTDIGLIKNISKCVEIEQAYLQSEESYEKRLRKSTINGSSTYTLSAYKILEDGSKVLVSEKQIDAVVYEQLLDFKEDNSNIIKKNRYYFSYNGEYLYLDIFDNNLEQGLLEINIDERGNIAIPSFISVIDDVSNNVMYYNRTLAEARRSRIRRVF